MAGRETRRGEGASPSRVRRPYSRFARAWGLWPSRAASTFTAWAERWIPDAFVFALVATGAVFLAGLVFGHEGPTSLVSAWGKDFWKLVPFTMQMALVIVTGYVLASSPPVARAIARLARAPRTARGATVMVAVFSMLTSWINWGFSLIFSALLARETARNRPEADYRALAASSFLGLGSVWAQGLSGSAALQMATPGMVQPKIREIVEGAGAVPGGLIPLTATIFTWQSLLSVAIEIALVGAVVWAYTPGPDRARTAAQMGVTLEPILAAPEPRAQAATPGERLEHSTALNLAVFALGATYLFATFRSAADKIAAIDLDAINFGFLMLGVLLHGTPARLMRAVREGTPATWGVILQFPFYAGIAGMITHSALNARMAGAFVRLSSRATFPPLIVAYSALLGVFVPSGGGKWVIEAPYILRAAEDLHVHLGWTVAVYNLGEALANLVQPFWMLPTLAILGLKARDVMGYTFVVFLVLTPVVLGMATWLGGTLGYPL
ncbi:MAG TPA: TIGR00366 family protein [Polyangiaceae bacterium]|nr:TIGR00366 family protein [Polyangiaceae bacterium]